jgi:hypothetical protein
MFPRPHLRDSGVYIVLFTCDLSNYACSDSNFTELNGRMSNVPRPHLRDSGVYIVLFTCDLDNYACSDSNFTELNGRMSNVDTMKGSVVTCYEIVFLYLISRSEKNHDRRIRNAYL